MRRVAAYTTVLFLLLALILVIGVVVLRPQFRAVGLQPYPALLPGQPIPHWSQLDCLFHYYVAKEYFYCRLRYDSRVLVSYSAPDDTIDRTWIDVNMSIGDLILAWGEPLGVSGGSSYWYVHFPGGRAAFIGSPYTPNTRVYFVRFADPARVGPVSQWKGFRQ